MSTARARSGGTSPRPSSPGATQATVGLTVSIVIPSYRRPAQLHDCLMGISLLDPGPDEIIVVRRDDDAETAALLHGWTGPSVVEVTTARPGQVNAMEVGARRAQCDIVAFIDDDAVPRPDWLAWLLAAYRGTDVGAVGGRDVVHHGDVIDEGVASTVGVITRTGRIIGGHHHGIGVARDVEHLKGANMSYRRRLIAFPRGLRGKGSEIHNDLAFSLSIRQRGWRVVYDPRAQVDHRPGRRWDADSRDAPTTEAVQNRIFNASYVLYGLRPELRRRRRAWTVLFGDRSAPGLARLVRAVLQRDWPTARLFGPSQGAQREAWRRNRTDPLVMEPLESP